MHGDTFRLAIWT